MTQELGVAVDATAVFRRTSAFTGDGTRIAAVVGRLDPLVHEHVLPVVAEVMRIHRGRGVPVPPVEERRQAHVPAGHDGSIPGVVIGGDSNRHHASLGRVQQPELVQVVVEPARRILEGDVQVPEGVSLGHLNAPPDERVGAGEHDQELAHQLRPRRGPLLGHRDDVCHHVTHSVEGHALWAELRAFGASRASRRCHRRRT